MNLEEPLQCEIYDVDWAPAAETGPGQLVASSIGADRAKLINSECVRAICRLYVGHADGRAANAFLHGLRQVAEAGVGTVPEFTLQRIPRQMSDDGLARSVFFIARTGHNLGPRPRR